MAGPVGRPRGSRPGPLMTPLGLTAAAAGIADLECHAGAVAGAHDNGTVVRSRLPCFTLQAMKSGQETDDARSPDEESAGNDRDAEVQEVIDRADRRDAAAAARARVARERDRAADERDQEAQKREAVGDFTGAAADRAAARRDRALDEIDRDWAGRDSDSAASDRDTLK